MALSTRLAADKIGERRLWLGIVTQTIRRKAIKQVAGQEPQEAAGDQKNRNDYESNNRGL